MWQAVGECVWILDCLLVSLICIFCDPAHTAQAVIHIQLLKCAGERGHGANQAVFLQRRGLPATHCQCRQQGVYPSVVFLLLLMLCFCSKRA